MGAPPSASSDNGHQLNQRRLCDEDCYQTDTAAAAAVNGTDVLRAGQVNLPVGLPGLAAVGSTMRRTLYSPRYTSDGRLKHYLATTTNDILSTQ